MGFRVFITNVKILPPLDECFEPCIVVECELELPPDKCIIELKGFLLSEEGKLISKLEEAPTFKEDQKLIYELSAKDNYPYRRKEERGTTQKGIVRFIAPLSTRTIEYLENLRERRPKRNIELKVRFIYKYFKSKVITAHFYEIPLSLLSSQLRTEIERQRVGTHSKSPESVIVYCYDPNFSTSRSNSWIMSSDSSDVFLEIWRGEQVFNYIIPYDDWIYDYLPKLKKHYIVVIELPFERVSSKLLAKAIGELSHAERALREGKYDSVLLSLRNIVLNHLTALKEVEIDGQKRRQRFLREELKREIMSSIPTGAKKQYEEVLKAIEDILRRMVQDHISNFIHLDTGGLLLMPLKEDAEYLFHMVTAIVKYLGGLQVLAGLGVK